MGKEDKVINIGESVEQNGKIEIPKGVLESTQRMSKLSQNIFKAINETTEEIEGDLTIYELNGVLIQILSSYNRRFLNEDQQRVPEDEK